VTLNLRLIVIVKNSVMDILLGLSPFLLALICIGLSQCYKNRVDEAVNKYHPWKLLLLFSLFLSFGFILLIINQLYLNSFGILRYLSFFLIFIGTTLAGITGLCKDDKSRNC